MRPSNKITQFFQIKDRKLGDEWQDWKGELTDTDTNANAGKRIFLGFLLLTIILTGAASFFLWYMIAPRLAQFHIKLPYLFAAILTFLWGLLSLYFLLIVLSIMTEKDFFLKIGKIEFSLTSLVPLIQKLGIRLGISADRMANSFVKVSNALIRTSAQKVKPETLLILLPRCLQKSISRKIVDFSQQFHIPVHIVPGGEKARKLVSEIHPKAIIGVACERDLLSGIRDVLHHAQVIGIPNIRPEGPCKNTMIDLKEFEHAIQTFLGPHIHFFSTNSPQ